MEVRTALLSSSWGPQRRAGRWGRCCSSRGASWYTGRMLWRTKGLLATGVLALGISPGADAGPPRQPARASQLGAGAIDVDLSGTIAGIRVGMQLDEVRARGTEVAPEGVERGEDKHGWVSGPVLIIVDGQARVEVVSVDLRRSHGIRVKGHTFGRAAKLPEIARALGRCTSGKGSGGNTLDCPAANGHAIHFYDTFGRDELTVSAF